MADTTAKDPQQAGAPTPPAAAGGEAQVKTPVAPPTAPVEPKKTEAPKELSHAELLQELDKRGFETRPIAEQFIRRFDKARSEAEEAKRDLESKREELQTLLSNADAREASLKEKAEKFLKIRDDALFQKEEAEKKIALLSKMQQ